MAVIPQLLWQISELDYPLYWEPTKVAPLDSDLYIGGVPPATIPDSIVHGITYMPIAMPDYWASKGRDYRGKHPEVVTIGPDNLVYITVSSALPPRVDRYHPGGSEVTEDYLILDDLGVPPWGTAWRADGTLWFTAFNEFLYEYDVDLNYVGAHEFAATGAYEGNELAGMVWAPNDKLYIANFGGEFGKGSIDVYDPATDTFSHLYSVPDPLSADPPQHRWEDLTYANGRLYICDRSTYLYPEFDDVWTIDSVSLSGTGFRNEYTSAIWGSSDDVIDLAFPLGITAQGSRIWLAGAGSRSILYFDIPAPAASRPLRQRQQDYDVRQRQRASL